MDIKKRANSHEFLANGKKSHVAFLFSKTTFNPKKRSFFTYKEKTSY